MDIFATSHVKQPWDGIGEIKKWLVSNASLKRDFKEQILSLSDMLQFCKENIQNITFKFISKADVDNKKVILNQTFEGLRRIPGIRSFHEFSPIDQYPTKMKGTSEDTEPSCIHNFKNQTKQNSVVQVLDYVSCLYDNKWRGVS